jgi:hypothetical protein
MHNQTAAPAALIMIAKKEGGMLSTIMGELPVIVYPPAEETENKYLAEVPILPGCRTWGETASEAVENMRQLVRKLNKYLKLTFLHHDYP